MAAVFRRVTYADVQSISGSKGCLQGMFDSQHQGKRSFTLELLDRKVPVSPESRLIFCGKSVLMK